MKVMVNELTVELFEGARVRNALLKYFTLENLDRALLTDDLDVEDIYGHLLDFDAPLTDGQSITFRFPESL